MYKYTFIIGMLLVIAATAFTSCRKNQPNPSTTETYVPLVQLDGGTVTLEDGYTPTVSAFFIGSTEVTQKEWMDVMGNDGNGPDADKRPSEEYGKGDKYPMYFVSFYDALVFCNKLSLREEKTPCYAMDNETDPDKWGKVPTANNDKAWDAITCDFTADGYRLPTEAEWQYAAQAGKEFTYSGSDKIEEVAWYNDNAESQTHEVGSKQPNAFSICDMSGNVREWCWDWFDGGYNKENTTNPFGPEWGVYHVVRGGAWNNAAKTCGVTIRDNMFPGDRRNTIGFRIVSRLSTNKE